MTEPGDDAEKIRKRLEDVTKLLATPGNAAPSEPSWLDPSSTSRGGGRAALGLSAALVVVAFATGQLWIVGPALALAVVAGLLLFGKLGGLVVSSLPAGIVPRDPTRAHIGMGATISSDARIEPGASVEMGAHVGVRAVVKRGGVVRMGASVHGGAIVEEGAVISWGATVGENAVVGANAIVGSGVTIGNGARVPAGTRILPGTTWAGGSGSELEGVPAPVPAVVETDPREQKINALCDRLETELRQAPPSIREYLGTAAGSIGPLRQTCHGLSGRERLLRAEATPAILSGLDLERAELERRIGSGTDDAIRRSLTNAVAAIEDQKRGRESMGRSADRIDAELTRLLWTLDGMGAQLVRLRSAGAEISSGPDAEMLRSVKQLHDEIDAVASALEEVAADDRGPSVFADSAPAPVSPIADASSGPRSNRDRA